MAKFNVHSFNSNLGNLNCLAGAIAEARVPLSYTPITRSYEKPYNWYLLVFSPMDVPYENDPEWFMIKGLDRIRDKFRLHETFLITRELNATKVHANMLICSKTDLTKMDARKCFHKYHIKAQYICNSLCDREHVYNYITKEFKEREPVKYLDYVIKYPYAQLAPSVHLA